MILYVFGEKWRTKMVLERLLITYGLCVLLMIPAIGLALYALYWAFEAE